METREPLIEIRELSKSFGGVKAVQAATFTLYRHEVVAIVGDNGAGKSTLIKMIAGTHLPDSGEIIIDGTPQHFRAPHDAIAMGIETMYQDLSLIPSLPPPANVFLGRELQHRKVGLRLLDHKRMEKETLEVVKRLEMDLPSLRTPVEYLSGGQRQAVALAKVLRTGKPRLLIMDEPTAALGVKEQANVLRLIQRLKDNGITTLIVSHNLDHVMSAAERILVMKTGKVVADLWTDQTHKDEVARVIVTGTTETVA